MRRFVLLMINIQFVIGAEAAVQANSIPFYRDITSRFASGHTSLDRLEKKIIKQEEDHSVEILWNNSKSIMAEPNLSRDFHCANRLRTKTNTLLLRDPRNQAQVVEVLNPKTELRVLQFHNQWAQVLSNSSQLGWISIQALEEVPTDLGLWITAIIAPLRERPEDGAQVTAFIPSQTRLSGINITHQTWLQVSYQQKTGYIHLQHLLNRIDFAHHVLLTNKQWVKVLYRENQHIVDSHKNKHPLSSALALKTDWQKAVVTKSSDNDIPPLRAVVTITNQKSDLWVQSYIEDHGIVWWKKNDLQIDKKSSETTTTQDILSKQLFSFSQFNKNSSEQIIMVSANGIYRSTDGQTWSQLSYFADSNWPIHIVNEKICLVGPYISYDSCSNFEPFVRWDLLTKTVQKHLGRSPMYLRLKQIRSLKNDIDYVFETGVRKVTLRGSLKSKEWNAVTNSL